MRFDKACLSKSKSMHSLIHIDMGEKGGTIGISPVVTGEFHREFSKRVDDARMVQLQASVKEVRNLNHEVITIHAQDVDIASTLFAGLFLKWEGTKVRAFTLSCGNIYTDVVTGNIVTGLELFDLRQFRLVCYSPAQEKKGEATFVDVTNGIEEVEERLNNVTFGTFGKFKGKEMTFKQGVKAQARLSQSLAPSVNLTNSATIAVHLSSKNEYKNGQGNVRASSLASWINKTSGKDYKPEDMEGVLAQARPMAANKGAFVATEDGFIDESILNMAGNDINNIVRMPYLEAANRSKEIDEGFNGNGFLAEKVLIVGEGTPDILTDFNAMKASVCFGRPSNFPVLDFAGEGDKTGRFSMQMLFNLLDIEGGLEFIQGHLNKNIEESYADLVSEENSVPSIKEFEKLYAAGITAKCAKSWATNKDLGIKKSLIKAFLQGQSRRISRMNIQIPGTFARALVDPAKSLGYEILREDEIMLKDASDYFAEHPAPEGEDNYVNNNRSPKPGSMDATNKKVVPVNEYVKRVMAEIENETHQKLLMRLISKIGRGILICPVSVEFTILHSGSDWDFDGFTVFFLKAYVDLARKQRELVTEVLEEEIASKQDNKKYVFSLDTTFEIWTEQMSNGNMTIGELCNINHAVLSLLSDLESARQVLKKFFKGGGKGKYEGLVYDTVKCYDHVVISTAKEKELLTCLRKVDFDALTHNEIKAIIIDLNQVFNMLIQFTIDSSKTAKKVKINLVLNKMLKCLSLKKMEIMATWSDSEKDKARKNKLKMYKDMAVKSDKSESDWDEEDRVFTFKDAFHTVKRTSLGILGVKAQEFYEKPVSLEMAQVADINSFKTKQYDSLIDSLIETKKLYNDIMSVFRSHKEEIADKYKFTDKKMSVVDRERIAVINRELKSSIDYVSNMVRAICSNLSPTETGMIVKMVSSQEKNKKVTDTGSPFAQSVIPEEHLLMVLALEQGAIDFAGEMIHKSKGLGAGDEIEIVEGKIVGSKKAFVMESLNGNFIVREHDGKLYASVLIRDLIKIPEVDRNKVALRFSWHERSRLEEIKDILSEEGQIIKIVSNPRDGDYVYTEKDGKLREVGKLATVPGNGPINKFYNGVVGKLDNFCIGKSNEYPVGVALINAIGRFEELDMDIDPEYDDIDDQEDSAF